MQLHNHVAIQPHNEMLGLGELEPHKLNYNAHSAEQIRKIAASLTKFGQMRSLVVWRKTLLAGHGVVEAARSLGWSELRADVLPDEYPPELAQAYLVADNELSAPVRP